MEIFWGIKCTFIDRLTNIAPNKTIRMRSSSMWICQRLKLAPDNSLLSGLGHNCPTYTKGDTVNVLISGSASSISEVEEVRLLSNGIPVGFSTPNGIQYSLRHNDGNPSHQLGFYQFSFEANTTGLLNLTPVIVDSFGNQRLATQPIIINVNSPSANSVLGTPPIINLVSPYKNDMGQTSVLSENNPSEVSDIKVGSSIPIAAFATDVNKDFQSLRFYCNGSPISDDISLDISKMFSDEHPYSLVWEANETGIFHFYAVGQDQAGNVSFSNVSLCKFFPRQVRYQVRPHSQAAIKSPSSGKYSTKWPLDSINLVSPGYGFVTEPEVRIDNFARGKWCVCCCYH